MSIQVGIQENICIKDVAKDDTGILGITFEEKGAMKNESTSNFLDELSSTETSDFNYDTTYKFWPIKFGEYVKNVEDVLNEFKVMRQKMNHILEQGMLKTDIKWDPMAGITVNDPTDNQERERLLTNEAVLAKMYDNMSVQFAHMVKTNISKDTGFRIKFVRQSKAKHYASLPKFPPFIEPMSIPKEQSALQFTKYEIENGYNSGKPTDEQAPPPDAEQSAKQQEEIESIFGNSSTGTTTEQSSNSPISAN